MFACPASVGRGQNEKQIFDVPPEPPERCSSSNAKKRSISAISDSPYNALLDVYEPGATIAELQPVFAALKARLVPLLKKITQSRVKIDDSVLHHSYDQARQLEFGRLVLTAMGYDFERGRLDLSAHPFTTSFHPTDVRVTTRVHEHELQSCLFSCIHEGGHGLYDQGLDQRYFGTPLGDSVSLGIHESQSRLWENCVGRSRPFWRFFYPVLQQTFHDQLRGVEIDQFYAAINCVKPSLIRVEADELTYNLHIMLRFEIEQDLRGRQDSARRLTRHLESEDGGILGYRSTL